MEIKTRKAEPRDVPKLLELVKELAEYEKALHEVENTTKQMLQDGFRENPLFGCIVAEHEKKIVGAALYYNRYSTWKGKRIYLEDLIVKEPLRRKGIGKLLFNEVIQLGKETNCSGMTWQVLDWNEPAIEFYKKYNSKLDIEWVNCNLEF